MKWVILPFSECEHTKISINYIRKKMICQQGGKDKNNGCGSKKLKNKRKKFGKTKIFKRRLPERKTFWYHPDFFATAHFRRNCHVHDAPDLRGNKR